VIVFARRLPSRVLFADNPVPYTRVNNLMAEECDRLALEGDPVQDFDPCPPGCNLCIDACPRRALDGTTVNQKECREISCFVNERGFVIKRCNVCRSVCPNSLGVRP